MHGHTKMDCLTHRQFYNLLHAIFANILVREFGCRNSPCINPQSRRVKKYSKTIPFLIKMTMEEYIIVAIPSSTLLPPDLPLNCLSTSLRSVNLYERL